MSRKIACVSGGEVGDKLGPRRTHIFRVSFTPEMGKRIDRISSEADLYASTLIREIVEVYVIEQEGLKRGISEERVVKNRASLMAELIKLNEELITMAGARDTIQVRLTEAARRENDDDAPEYDGD